MDIQDRIASDVSSLKIELDLREQLLAEHNKIVATFGFSEGNAPKMKQDIIVLNQLINTLKMAEYLSELIDLSNIKL